MHSLDFFDFSFPVLFNVFLQFVTLNNLAKMYSSMQSHLHSH